MEQLLLTIDFFHQKGVVHRDIKLENILIHKIEDGRQYEVKIADFGIAEFLPTKPDAEFGDNMLHT
jgi:serine/threonine protein kinase